MHFIKSLLNDKLFTASFIYFILFFWKVFKEKKSSFKSIHQWWFVAPCSLYGKVQIKQFPQQYTRNVTKVLNRSLEMLEKELMDLPKFSYTSSDSNLRETLLKKKAELKELLEH